MSRLVPLLTDTHIVRVPVTRRHSQNIPGADVLRQADDLRPASSPPPLHASRHCQSKGSSDKDPYKLTYVRGHRGLLVMLAEEMQVL